MIQRLPFLTLVVLFFASFPGAFSQTGWFPRGSAPTMASLNDITYNPSDGSIYVSTPTGQLFKSQNNGNAWTQLNTTVPDNLYEQIDGIADIALDPVTESLIVGIGAGVFITPNDGGGWTHECFYQSNGQSGGCSNGHIVEVFFNGTSSIIMSGGFLSATNGSSWLGTIGSAVVIYDYFRGGSTNYAVVRYQGNMELIKLNGTTWQLAYQLPAMMENGSDYVAEMDGNGHMFMVVTEGYTGNKGLFKSTNNGAAWTDISASLGDTLLTDIAIDGNDYIYVATENNGIYRSTDGGNQWNSLNTGLADTRINRVAVTNTGKLFALGETGGFYAFNTGTFAWEQRNKGLNAAPQITDLSFDGGNRLWAFNNVSGMVYENTSVYENTWTARSAGITNSPAFGKLRGVHRAADQSYFSYDFGRVFHYDEGTNTWADISVNNTLPPMHYLHKVASVNASDVFAFYFNSQGSKVRYTANGGSSWETALTITGHNLYDMASTGVGKLVMATAQNGFGTWMISLEQNGSSFDTSMVPLPLPASMQFAFPWPRIRVAPSGDIYVVILGNELWKFDEGAGTFTQLPAGDWPSQFQSSQEPWLSIDNSDALWFSYPEHGVFYSADQGQSWSKRSLGYDSTEYLMNYIAFDDGGTAHGLIPAGIHYWGLDTFGPPVDTTDTSGNDTINNPSAIFEQQEQFNWQVISAGDQLVLQIQTSALQQNAVVTVYDLMGRAVLHHRLGTIQRGMHRFVVGSPGQHGVLAVRLRTERQDETQKIIN